MDDNPSSFVLSFPSFPRVCWNNCFLALFSDLPLSRDFAFQVCGKLFLQNSGVITW